MAKKKIEIFIDINNKHEFNYILDHNLDRLICANLFCSFAGPCTALDFLFIKIKLDWGDGNVVLLRVLVDEIDYFSRFQRQSEPIFLFIYNRKINRVYRGVNYIEFAEVAKKEIDNFKLEQEGNGVDRETFELYEASFGERKWLEKLALEERKEDENLEIQRRERQMARKRHRAELMVPHLQHLNFVLYWPHTVHAHPQLYERWNENNIIMVGREAVCLTREMAEDVFYAGDAPLNEASLHILVSGPALAICFRLLDTEKHFVSVVRHILYDEFIKMDEIKSSDIHSGKTAYDMYKTYSPTREQFFRQRLEAKMKKKEEIKVQRARRLSEMQRLAKQAIEEAIQAKKLLNEQRKLELLKAGNLSALEQLHQEREEDNVNIVVPQELSEEESSEEENDNQYLPPPGLLIPGFYSPPNDIAKANGLAVLFPKLVSEYITPEEEFLPPHVLVLFDIEKRYKAIDAIKKRKKEIIHIGIFQVKNINHPIHVAFSIKQFEAKKQMHTLENLKLAFMVSTKSDFALLELIDVGPDHVSRDDVTGEIESSMFFTVDYGDRYPEFEDFM